MILPVVVIASFLLAFKAVLIEGSEVAIIALSIIRQVGRGNVFFGVLVGGLGSVGTFLVVRQVFLLLPDILINLGTGAIILYFSYRFLRGFVKYYFGGKSFRAKMEKMSGDVVHKEMETEEHHHPQIKGESESQSASEVQIPGRRTFSPANSLPVLLVTLVEGFEASLVLAAAGAFNLEWTVVGALTSIVLLVTVCAISYDYLMRVPRWFLDLFAGLVLLTFGLYFAASGVLIALGIIS